MGRSVLRRSRRTRTRQLKLSVFSVAGSRHHDAVSTGGVIIRRALAHCARDRSLSADDALFRRRGWPAGGGAWRIAATMVRTRRQPALA